MNRPGFGRVACVAFAAIVTMFGGAVASAEPGDERVDPLVAYGRVRTFPWMRSVPPADFRNVGPLFGLKDEAPSFSVNVADVNADGWSDLVMSRHGWVAALLLTDVEDGVPVRFVTSWRFHDDIHHRVDRHGCAVADVDLNGLPDVYCAKGAHGGTARKWNELWIQNADGTFTDRAHEFGVEDVWGRGRFPAFLDLDHDPWPDLFVGNDFPRQDRHTTPNRTFASTDGLGFHQVHLGVTRQVGDRCTTVADVDGDGWDDALVCGRDRLHLYRRRAAGFRDVTEAAGLPDVVATAARLADVDGDGRLDLVYAEQHRLTIARQGPAHRFRTVFHLRLRHGHGLAVGDPDGDGDPDVYVVEGCVDGRDMPDWYLVREPRAFAARKVPAASTGCGDTAEAFDLDQDGKDEFVVLNGGGVDQGLKHHGPEWLLTLGDWQPPGATA